MGASSRGDAPWLFALCVASVAAQDGEATDRVVDEAIASLKAMAGLNAKVFTTEDLQNMGPEAFACVPPSLRLPPRAHAPRAHSPRDLIR